MRSAMPKYSFGSMFINIEPANNSKNVHKDNIPGYFISFVLKNPMTNDMSAIMVNKTTIIVTAMCIVS
jgi:hypothetical protein